MVYMARTYFAHWLIRQLMEIWVVFTFSVIQQNVAVDIHIDFWRDILNSLWCISGNCWSYGNYMFNFWGISTRFPKSIALFYMCTCNFFTSSSTFVIFHLFYLDNFYEWGVVSLGYSKSFHVTFAYLSSLEKCQRKVGPPFINELVLYAFRSYV